MRSAGSRLVHPGILQNHDYCRPLVNESEAVFSSYHMSSSIYPTNLYHLGYCQKAATNEHCPEPEDEADSEFLMCRSSVKVNEPNIPTCNTSYFSFFYLFSLFFKKNIAIRYNPMHPFHAYGDLNSVSTHGSDTISILYIPFLHAPLKILFSISYFSIAIRFLYLIIYILNIYVRDIFYSRFLYIRICRTLKYIICI